MSLLDCLENKVKRIIKFRGFSVNENRWIYGDLSQGSNGVMSISNRLVEHDSIGQFTGLHDKNGVEIYEGDVFNLPNNRSLVCVEYVDDMFHLKSFKYKNLSDGNFRLNYYAALLEIIGNKYQNPEILK
jgi:uncharacterized phage protein (TIGR01671 family)